MTNFKKQAYLSSLQAELLAISIEVTGMVSFNEERAANGMAQGYDEQDFHNKANEVRRIKSLMEVQSRENTGD